MVTLGVLGFSFVAEPLFIPRTESLIRCGRPVGATVFPTMTGITTALIFSQACRGLRSGGATSRGRTGSAGCRPATGSRTRPRATITPTTVWTLVWIAGPISPAGPSVSLVRRAIAGSAVSLIRWPFPVRTIGVRRTVWTALAALGRTALVPWPRSRSARPVLIRWAFRARGALVGGWASVSLVSRTVAAARRGIRCPFGTVSRRSWHRRARRLWPVCRSGGRWRLTWIRPGADSVCRWYFGRRILGHGNSRRGRFGLGHVLWLRR